MEKPKQDNQLEVLRHQFRNEALDSSKNPSLLQHTAGLCRTLSWRWEPADWGSQMEGYMCGVGWGRYLEKESFARSNLRKYGSASAGGK
jgi:hypothetical protein